MTTKKALQALIVFLIVLMLLSQVSGLIVHSGDIYINQTVINQTVNGSSTNMTRWAIDNYTLINNSNILEVNMSLINDTIDNRAGSTTGFNLTDGSLNNSGSRIGVNTTYIQRRVITDCGVDKYLSAIADDGTGTCQNDENTDTYNTTVEMRNAVNGSAMNASNFFGYSWYDIENIPSFNNGTGGGNTTAEMQAAVNNSALNLSNSFGYDYFDLEHTPTINNASTGDCAAGQVMQNITDAGVECVAGNLWDTDTYNTTTEMRNAVNISSFFDIYVDWYNIFHLPSFNNATGGNSTTEIRDAVNSSIYYQIKVLWTNLVGTPTINNASTGDCAAGQVMQNITDAGVECVAGNLWDTDTYNTTTEMINAVNISSFFQMNIDWNNLINVPAGFSDGIDNESAGSDANNSALNLSNSFGYDYFDLEHTPTINNASTGDCAAGQVMQNITDAGVECIAGNLWDTDTYNTTVEMRNAVNNTALDLDEAYFYNGTSSFNGTHLCGIFGSCIIFEP